jgi:hypothetical protein
MRKIAEYLYETHFKETSFDSFIECQKNGKLQLSKLQVDWSSFYQLEQNHKNPWWSNIGYGEYRRGKKCKDL